MSLSPKQADAVAAPGAAGFRLQRLEVFNWGTFHQRVWHLAPGGENALLTGDIGSGKSTLVDALTTLLVPPKKLSYNKASGAESKERSLRSYVLGHFKSERTQGGGSARPVSLRGQRDYSVLLGQFYHQQLEETVTLAQVFWLPTIDANPSRFYVLAEEALSIVEHFSGFGDEIKQLRKQLRGQGQEIFDSFSTYCQAFRRRLGIANESALSLFHQTVSMKSVGNLTDFVRLHMLEPFSVRGRIDALITHFEDLNRAHGAVLEAKKKIAALEPLVENGKRHQTLAAEVGQLRRCREALSAFFADRFISLLRAQEMKLGLECARQSGQLADLVSSAQKLELERDELKLSIAQSGGLRLEQLKSEIARSRDEKAERSERDARYRNLVDEVELPPVIDERGFANNAQSILHLRAEAHARQTELINDQVSASSDKKAIDEEHQQLLDEVASLRARRSNLPSRMLQLRARLAQELKLDEEALPFVGELLRVRPNERDWEGVSERLLGSFGMSLLVSERDYAAVATWVENNHLAARLVYFRVSGAKRARGQEIEADSLVHKLEVKPDTEHRAWIEAELRRRFDYLCCENIDRFRRANKAVTLRGQIKQPGDRHEKDDRHRLDDRSRYVLGWTNEEKIATLELAASRLFTRAQQLAEQMAALNVATSQLREQLDRLSRLAAFEGFRQLDWRSVALHMAELLAEQRELESTSDKLRVLEAKLAVVEKKRQAVGEKLAEQSLHLELTKQKMKRGQERMRACEKCVTELAKAQRAPCFEALATLLQEALPGTRLNPESEVAERKMRKWIQERIDALDARLSRLEGNVVQAMHQFRTAWPMASQEVDAALAALAEYSRMLAQLLSDDLPSFEERFKRLLNENTINEIASFQAQLYREEQDIKDRIDVINKSLRAIEYNPERFIALEAVSTHDTEIRDFRQDLRACTEDALTGTGGEAYAETKFLRVRAIIERFVGREGTSDLDARWTAKVTDVRSWFSFSASERWAASDQEHEHYSDSGGKSGGQKEKLAYTVLAASLAYQLAPAGRAAHAAKARSFRFVVIDEAFGRGTDESARYGLELFGRMGLQVLVVTPLQKLHVIEPYVASVGFVDNVGGQSSQVRNLTIEEYREEREARRL